MSLSEGRVATFEFMQRFVDINFKKMQRRTHMRIPRLAHVSLMRERERERDEGNRGRLIRRIDESTQIAEGIMSGRAAILPKKAEHSKDFRARGLG